MKDETGLVQKQVKLMHHSQGMIYKGEEYDRKYGAL